MDKTQIFKNAGLALSEKPMFVRNGSKVSLSATPLFRQLSGVKQTEPDESGPLAAELLVSGV